MTPTQASAHSASNTPSSNFHGRITSIVPATNNFRIAVIEATSRVELTWRTGPELVVPGYDDDPYLRIGPTGVYENQASSATYLNRDRQGATPLPPNTGPDQPPVWKQLSKTPTARWHDHRVHWMGTTTPPIVARNPREKTLVQRWTIPVLQGNRTHVVNGRLDWEPGRSSTPFLAVAFLVPAATLAFAVRARRDERRRIIASQVLACAMAALVAIDIVHLITIAAGVRGPGLIARLFSIGFASIAGWLAGLIGTSLILRRRLDGIYLTVFSAFVALTAGGFADVNILSNSATAATLPIGVVRVLVTATIGFGLSIVAAGITLTGHAEPVGSSPADPGQ